MKKNYNYDNFDYIAIILQHPLINHQRRHIIVFQLGHSEIASRKGKRKTDESVRKEQQQNIMRMGRMFRQKSIMKITGKKSSFLGWIREKKKNKMTKKLPLQK